MHIVMVVATGLILLAAVYFADRQFNADGKAFDPGWIFIWSWLAISAANGVYGYMRAGIPLLNEVGAFVPIFGIPAALAWFLFLRR